MNLYTEAAAILEKVENKQGSVKSLVFASEYKNVRQLYALVCESLKYQPVLTTIFKRCRSLQQEEALQGQDHMAAVLLYEHLLGKGLGRAGRIRSCIMRHKLDIRELCNKLLKEKGVTALPDLLSLQCQAMNKLRIPRYVRVNFLKTTLENAVATFCQEGWVWQGVLSLQNFQSDVERLGQEKFGRDPLLPDLLVFPSGTDLHNHPWVTGGSVVLQDRASCFPVHVLNPPQGATVMDCCSAPGNKTSHAASLMGHSGKIWAYERDGVRLSLLKWHLRRCGSNNTKIVFQDFLSVDPHDKQFADVEYVLVDPSCSGSGIVSRMDHVSNENGMKINKSSQERLLSLQRFQISILKHALQFPAARRVVYSTCSIYEEENEAVVAEVAQQVKDKFRLKTVFPEFLHRGKGGEAVAEKCVRTSPKKDLTNGFFVACFERISGDPGEEDIERERNENVGKQAKAEVHEEIGRQTKQMEISSSKKNRKRKHEEENQSADTVHGVGASDATVSLSQNGNQDGESVASSPKKRMKTKHKSKQEQTQSESTKTQNQQKRPEVASTSDAKKQKTRKDKAKNGKGDACSVQTDELPNTSDAFLNENLTAERNKNKPTVTSTGDNVCAEKPKKKKKKSKKKVAAENEKSASTQLQIEELAAPSFRPLFISEETSAPKKKGKKKGKKGLCDEHTQQTSSIESLSVSEDPKTTGHDEDQDSKPRRRKSKKHKR